MLPNVLHGMPWHLQNEQMSGHSAHRETDRVQSNTHVLFTWLLVVSSHRNEKLLFDIFSFALLVYKKPIHSIEIAGCRWSFFACTAMCEWIFAYSNLYAYKIPNYCGSIGDGNYNSNNNKRIEHTLLCELPLNDVEDLCNVVTAQTIIFLVTSDEWNSVKNVTFHMHKTIRQWQSCPDSYGVYQCRVECKNPYAYARAQHTHIFTHSLACTISTK